MTVQLALTPQLAESMAISARSNASDAAVRLADAYVFFSECDAVCRAERKRCREVDKAGAADALHVHGLYEKRKAQRAAALEALELAESEYTRATTSRRDAEAAHELQRSR